MSSPLRPERCDLQGTKALVDAAKAKGGKSAVFQGDSYGEIYGEIYLGRRCWRIYVPVIVIYVIVQAGRQWETMEQESLLI